MCGKNLKGKSAFRENPLVTIFNNVCLHALQPAACKRFEKLFQEVGTG